MKFVLRFHNIQQKISEGERTCDLLLLACLTSLRCSLDVAAEGKRGEAYIDQLCLELEDGDAKRGKKKKKKERKNKDMSDDIGKRDDCRECRSSVESCLDEEEDREGNVTCSFSVAVENQRKEAYKDKVCLELEEEGDAKKDTKKEKKKKKKQEQRNRKNSSESDDKRYCEENRSSVESTTMSEEESSVAINDPSLDVEKAEVELPVELEDGVSEVRRMTKAEKKNAKKEKKRIQQQQQQADEREEKKTCEAIVELCDNKTEKEEEEEEEDKDNGYSSDITFDNKRDEISLDFEDMGGNWEEATKGKKKKKKQDERRKVQMADLVQELENRRMDFNNGGRREYCGQSKIPTESPELSDEPEAVDNENKENSSVSGKLERRSVCHKGLRKEVLVEPRDPRPRPRPVTLVSAFSANKCSRPIRSLADMLEEEEKDVVEQIPDEVIIRFLLSADETAKRRKELRENLRRRFADFCNCHHTRYCPSKSF